MYSDNTISSSVALMAIDAAKNIADRSIIDAELRDAMQIEEIVDGVRIGSWEIVKVAGEFNSYHVRDLKGRVIFSDIVFYDSARQLVGLLAKGCSPNTREAASIMAANDEFIRAKADEAFYAERIRSRFLKGDSLRAMIAEDRLSETRCKIDSLRQKLRSFA